MKICIWARFRNRQHDLGVMIHICQTDMQLLPLLGMSWHSIESCLFPGTRDTCWYCDLDQHFYTLLTCLDIVRRYASSRFQRREPDFLLLCD